VSLLEDEYSGTVSCGDGGSFAAKSYENTRGLRSLGRPAFAPRAFLQIFIKTTPHHRLVLVGDPWFAWIWALISLFLRFSQSNILRCLWKIKTAEYCFFYEVNRYSV
jgi:hypothetical protein